MSDTSATLPEPTLYGHEEYEALAGHLRAFLGGTDAEVLVVNGGQGGFWLEIRRDTWYFMTSDRDGRWGISFLSADPAMNLRNLTLDMDGFGIEAFWYHDRHDGPRYTSASYAVVLSYFMECGIFSGTPPIEGKDLRDEDN